jgi:hypothetical protein
MKQFCSFSEAIREGLKMRPNQAFFKLSSAANNASCVVGAGFEAMAGRLMSGTEKDRAFRDRFLRDVPYPYLLSTTTPPCGCKEPLEDGSRLKWGGGRLPIGERQTAASIFNVAVHLNNHHQWTRERIADWLELEEERLGFVTLVDTVEERETVSLSR